MKASGWSEPRELSMNSALDPVALRIKGVGFSM